MLKKLLTIFFGILVGLIFVELLLRIIPTQTYHGQRTENRQNLYEYDELLGWRMKKNVSITEIIYNRKVTYKTNKLGFRGSLPDKNKKIIALMGDSLIFGVGLNENETISANLENLTGASVLNTGVIGYAPDQIYLQLKRDILPLKPDIVIFTIFPGNDLDDLPNKIPISFAGLQPQKPYFEIINGNLVLKNYPVPKEKILSKKTTIYNMRKFLKENIKILNLIKPYIKYYLYNPLKKIGILEGIDSYRKSFEILEKILSETKKITDINKIRMYVMILPRDFTKWDRLQQEFLSEIINICKKHNIKYILPLNPLEVEKYYFKNSWHPSQYGSKVIAEKIKEVVGL